MIPALFLRPHLKRLSNPNIEFYVFCPGFGYTEPADDFDTFFTKFFDSKDFRIISSDPCGKIIRRICIWMTFKSHVAFLCWDKFNKGPLTGQHILTLCDNMNGQHINKVKLFDAFRTKSGLPVNTHIRFQINSFKCFATSEEFACVSFMARSTLYASFFECIESTQGNLIESDIPIFDDMRSMYACFEKRLTDVLQEKISNGRVALFHPLVSSCFLNINNVQLVFIDTTDDNLTQEVFVYTHLCGGKVGFASLETDEGSLHSPASCNVQSSLDATSCMMMASMMKPSRPHTNTSDYE